MNWMQWLLLCGGCLLMASLGLWLYGTWRWKRITQDLLKRLTHARDLERAPPFDLAELAHLPEPVQRYLRIVLTPGQPIISTLSFSHSGTFMLNGASAKWQSFSSTQHVVVNRPGFVWNARIQSVAGSSIYVHDSYIAREGALQASLFGVVDMVNIKGTKEMAEGELLRFLAETPLYPTALLPRHGISWEAIDSRSASATLTDQELRVTMTFKFNEMGVIEQVWARARAQLTEHGIVYMPWQGTFWDYQARDGMTVPLQAEVSWMAPGGAKPYYRGRLTAISFDAEP